MTSLLHNTTTDSLPLFYSHDPPPDSYHGLSALADASSVVLAAASSPTNSLPEAILLETFLRRHSVGRTHTSIGERIVVSTFAPSATPILSPRQASVSLSATASASLLFDQHRMQPPPSIRPTSAPPVLRRTRRSSSSRTFIRRAARRAVRLCDKEKALPATPLAPLLVAASSALGPLCPPTAGQLVRFRLEAQGLVGASSSSTMCTSAPARLLRYRYRAALIARPVTSDGASTYPSSIHEPNKAETPPHGAAGSMRSSA